MNSGETLGVAVFVSFLVAFAAAVLIVVTGHLGDVMVWALGAELLRQVATWTAVAAVVGALGWGVTRGEFTGAHGHVHHVDGGTDDHRAALKCHENAHQRVGARVGAGGSTIRIWPENGGWSGTNTWHNPAKVVALPPEKQIAIKLAGIMAAPSTESPTDMPHVKAIARSTPNPGKAMREGRKIARRYI